MMTWIAVSYTILDDIETSTSLERERFRQLDKFPKLLESLNSAFESIRNDVRACIPALSVCDLPDEITMHILKLVCTNIRSVVQASFVCKHFRRMVLSSPRLWAACTLTLNMSPHIVDVIATRSGSLGLDVKILDTVNYRNPARLSTGKLTKLFQYSSRWKSAIFKPSSTTWQAISSNFPYPNLRSLVELSINDSFSLLSTYTNWTLPALRILRVQSDDTLPISFARKVPCLTNCQLLLRDNSVSFLPAITGLVALNLQITDSPAQKVLNGSTTLSLPLLRKLGLEFHGLHAINGSNIVKAILPLILCPNITELVLCMNESHRGLLQRDTRTLQEEWEIEQTRRTILACKNALPLLKELYQFLRSFSLFISQPGRMKTTISTPQEKLFIIDDVLEHLPNTIESVNLAAWSIPLSSHRADIMSDISGATHPNLTSLAIAPTPWTEKTVASEVRKELGQRSMRLEDCLSKDASNAQRQIGPATMGTCMYYYVGSLPPTLWLKRLSYLISYLLFYLLLHLHIIHILSTELHKLTLTVTKWKYLIGKFSFMFNLESKKDEPNMMFYL